MLAQIRQKLQRLLVHLHHPLLPADVDLPQGDIDLLERQLTIASVEDFLERGLQGDEKDKAAFIGAKQLV